MRKNYEQEKSEFKKKEQKMLEKLVFQFGISETDLASRLGVDQRTIQRWLKAETTPYYSARKHIAQIYNGYKARGIRNEER